MSTVGSVPTALPCTAAAAAADAAAAAPSPLPGTLVGPPATPNADLRALEDEPRRAAPPTGETETPGPSGCASTGAGLGPGAEATAPMMASSELEVACACRAAGRPAPAVVSAFVSPPARLARSGSTASRGALGSTLTAAVALAPVVSSAGSLLAESLPATAFSLLCVLDATFTKDKLVVAAAVAASAAGPLTPCREAMGTKANEHEPKRRSNL